MNSRKRYKLWAPTQSFVLPPSPMDWLPKGHLAYFILDVIGELDLSPIEARINEKDARGTRPFAPEMMVSLLLYGYCVGVFSSRKLERATYEDVAFRVLAGGEQPHFTTINGFRKQHLDVLRSLFLQVLRLCQTAGLLKLGHVALDGTKVQANASKHKAMSYERMLKSELELTEEIDALMARAAEVDQAEDERFGEGQREEDLPAELHRREERLKTIRAAKARLEAESAEARARELREQAARAGTRAETHDDPTERKRASTVAKNKAAAAKKLAPKADDDDLEPPKTDDGLPKHEPNAKTDGKPHDKAQMNFTDPDSRIMESGGAFHQAYNCQAAVDEEHQIIVGQSVSNLSPDNGALVPVLEQVRANCGGSASTTTADAGYWRPDAREECERLETDVYISTRRRKHGGGGDNEEAPPPEEPGGRHNAAPRPEDAVDDGERPPPDAPADERERMRAKLATDEGRRIYAKRKAVVEPVFGQIKEARGFRRFMLRGLEQVQAEWALVCAGHNLLKLWRHEMACAA